MKWRGTYDDYLQSPYWRLHVRRQALERSYGYCQQCLGEFNLEVHHLTYDRLGCELPEDLAVLCASCHSRLHGFDRAPALPRGPVSLGAIIAQAQWRPV